MSFWPANIVTSVIFIHCLGWAFQGVLATNLFSVTAGSVMIFRLVAGWWRYKSDSLYGGIILHSLNNLFPALKQLIIICRQRNNW
jgi:hypothetical protein